MNCLTLLLPIFLWVDYVVAHVYTDTWAVHMEGGPEHVQAVVEQHGFTYLGEIMPDHYHLRHHHVSKRSVYPSIEHHSKLEEHPQENPYPAITVLSPEYSGKHKSISYLLVPCRHSSPGHQQVHWVEQQVVKSRVKRDATFNDPKWPRMWYLRRGHGLDMNVQRAWAKGITGRDIVVSILDDGIEKDHPDLKINYDAQASYDVNNRDPDPQPRYDYTNENRHGTRCAGEVAAQANNRICSVGVAYNARIGGVRMLDGDVTDAVEAQSLSLNPQHIDIYSASWGPDDDGKTVDGPATLAKKAFLQGIQRGRRGKGSIFVWASGNGGRDHDSCNCDGYTNSLYTVSVSSATENGNIPWYSEACSSTLATTYSSGSAGERQIVTTDLRKGCTETHTGTSASAPLAAGICALTLEANPSLTWRDLQHIVVMGARPANLKAKDWVTNGVGRRVSHSFGFGLMDASAMVDLALNWTNVPKQHKCSITAPIAPRGVPIYSVIHVSLESDGCARQMSNQVTYVEHVQSIITLTSSRRGQVQIRLTSPQGTTSTLLQRRIKDNSMEGFENWAFMTTHNWGEMAMGTWVLEVENGESTSELKSWTLVMHGTATHPQGGSQGQRQMQNPYSGLDHTQASSAMDAVVTTAEHLSPSSTEIMTSSIQDISTESQDISTESQDISTEKSIITSQSTATMNVAITTKPPIRRPIPSIMELQCKEDQFLMNNFCFDACPAHFYESEVTLPPAPDAVPPSAASGSSEAMSSEPPVVVSQTSSEVRDANDTTANSSVPIKQKVCLECHVTCSLCCGPTATDCLACAAGFDLINSSCLHTAMDVITKQTDQKFWLYIIAMSLCFGAIFVFILVFVGLQLRSGSFHAVKCCSNKPRYVDLNRSQYNGVRLQSTDKSLLASDSDDESEDEDFNIQLNGNSASPVVS